MSDVRSFHVARYAVLVTVATLQASRSHQYLPDHFMYSPAPTEPRDVKTDSGMKCRPEQTVSWATAAAKRRDAPAWRGDCSSTASK
jgi:hypothetical protein